MKIDHPDHANRIIFFNFIFVFDMNIEKFAEKLEELF